MIFKSLLLFLAFSSVLTAQEWKPETLQTTPENTYPFDKKEIPQAPTSDSSQVLLTTLKNLVLKQKEAFPALTTRLHQHLGKPLTENGLTFLIDLILSHYDREGFPVVDVVLPEQDISEGTLILEVIKGRVGTVGLQKSKHFKNTLLARAVRLKSGQIIRARDLQRDLDWLGRNPFRKATLYATPGDQPASGNFLFGLTERPPWRLYTGYQNTGTEAAGRDRFSVGFNWGNAFGQDHLLNYQFTTGNSLDNFRAHAFSWEIPLHQSHHFLRFSGARADVQSRQNSLTSDGGYRELALALGRPLDRWHGLAQEVSLGFEWKNIDNFATFGAVSLPGIEVDLWQLRLAYRASGMIKKGRFDLTAEALFSPGNLSGQNSNSDFSQFRSEADSKYGILRTRAQWQREVWNRWSLKLALQGQYSPDKLLPSEQLGLGGNGSVRGYSEREFLADAGYTISAELGTPAFKWRSLGLQGVTFLDHGTGWRHDDDDSRQSLTGIGLGLRLQAGSFLESSIDWAVSREGGSEWHFGFLATF